MHFVLSPAFLAFLSSFHFHIQSNEISQDQEHRKENNNNNNRNRHTRIYSLTPRHTLSLRNLEVNLISFKFRLKGIHLRNLLKAIQINLLFEYCPLHTQWCIFAFAFMQITYCMIIIGIDKKILLHIDLNQLNLNWGE